MKITVTVERGINDLLVATDLIRELHALAELTDSRKAEKLKKQINYRLKRLVAVDSSALINSRYRGA